MTKSLIAKTVFSLAAVLSINGCSKNEDLAQVSVPFTMTASNSSATVAKASSFQKILNMLLPSSYAYTPSVLVDSNGTTVSLSEAWVMIKEIEFKAAEVAGSDEVDGAEVEFTGPYAVDLLSTTPSVLDTQQIPQMAFKRIKMQFHKAENAVAGAPAGLLNNSIYLSGTVGANNFTYQADDSTEFEISGPNAVLPSSGDGILVQIQLANIIKQIDLSSLPNGAAITSSSRYAGASLCPSIDASANDIYTCIRKGLEAHADWGCDKDGDDDLDIDDDSVN